MKLRIVLMRALDFLPRALVLAAVLGTPLFAMQSVRASNDNVLEGIYEKSNGAGLVLMVSLQRSR